ncbi:hypothetical protein MKW92_015676, partial [Papaver armeniacum]
VENESNSVQKKERRLLNFNANHRQNYNQRLRVYSTKSNDLSTIVDAVALVQAIRTGWVHPNVNLENPEVGVSSLALVGPKKERLDIFTFLVIVSDIEI